MSCRSERSGWRWRPAGTGDAAGRLLFKAELVRHRRPWKSIEDLEIAVGEYIDWFNHRRLHGELGLVPSAEGPGRLSPPAAGRFGYVGFKITVVTAPARSRVRRSGAGAAVRTVQTGVDVAAEPSVVWGVLTDFASYPTWSSYVQEITGSLTKGGRVRVVQGVAGRRPFAFRARVLDVTAERGFTWRGGLPGLFVGTHEFALTALPDGGTHLLQRETFRGLLSVLGAPRGWVPGFSSFNEALRDRAELGRA